MWACLGHRQKHMLLPLQFFRRLETYPCVRQLQAICATAAALAVLGQAS